MNHGRQHALLGFESHYAEHPDEISPVAFSTISTPPYLETVGTKVRMSRTAEDSSGTTPLIFNASYYSAALCHIWFHPEAKPGGLPSPPHYHHDTSYQPLHIPTQEFRNFVCTVLDTTAVTEAVVVLSLWYIHRLRQSTLLVAAAGSEYRLCAASLMLANKYLDDNTYTSKTWSSVTSIPLIEMNLMEVELISSLGHAVGIKPTEYIAWIQALDTITYHCLQTATRRSSDGYHAGSVAAYALPTWNPVQPSSTYRARSYSPYRRNSYVQSFSIRSDTPISVGEPIPPPRMTRKRTAYEMSPTQTTEPARRIRNRGHYEESPLHCTATSAPEASQTYSIAQHNIHPSYRYIPQYGHPDLGTMSGPARNDWDILQLPYVYHSDRAPGPEDLTFYTLAASPVYPEAANQDPRQHDYKTGKPRIAHHGQSQPSAQRQGHPFVYAPPVGYPIRYHPQVEAERRSSAPHVAYYSPYPSDTVYPSVVGPPRPYHGLQMTHHQP